MTDTDKANAHDWLNEIVTNQEGWRMFYSDSETKSCAEAVLALLKEQETVVRCKDCRHCYFASNRIPCEQSLMCAKTGNNITPDWFCADGERR